jgi:hypothetical protein
MVGLERTHQEIRAIDLGPRGAIRVVCLRYTDVVERLHERSE